MIGIRPMTLLAPADKLLRAARDRELDAPIRLHEPMAPHTSLRVGGPAEIFVDALTLEHLMGWVTLARDYDVPLLILGRGSNILVSDAGIRGVVINNLCSASELRVHGYDGGTTATLYAESGASLPGLAYSTARQGWAGLEWAIGIPSSIGAAVVNNAGAHDGDTAGALVQATILGERGNVYRATPDTLGFAYRTSRLKGNGCREIVLSAEFALRQEDLRVLAERMARYTEHRRRTQPTEPSVGSVFKNPPGDFAGRLIEACGLKGYRIGGAMISPMHGNWVINTGSATAGDIMALIDLMRERVWEEFEIELELEIELVGEW